MENVYKKDYQAIFFDLDGTLYHEKRFKLLFLILHPLQALKAKKLGDLRNIARNKQEFGKSNYEFIDSQINQKIRLKIQNEVWPSVLGKVGYFNGVDSVLNYYKKKGVFLAVVSDDAPEKKLERLGLKKYFDFVVDLNDHGCLKPSSEYLNKVLKEKDLIPGNCLFVGDKENLDGKLAKNLGMNFLYKPNFKDWFNKLLS